MENDPNQMTRHHKLARSRGGTDDPSNIKIITRKVHDAYNLLFTATATANNAIEQIRNGKFSNMTDKQWTAWQLLFGHEATPSEAIMELKENW